MLTRLGRAPPGPSRFGIPAIPSRRPDPLPCRQMDAYNLDRPDKVSRVEFLPLAETLTYDSL